MRCRNCKDKFEVKRFNDKYCYNEECQNLMIRAVLKKVKVKKDKEQRKDKKERLERLKTNSDYLKDTQKVVNKYIRERDKNVPWCVSCGKIINGVRHASHFMSSGGNSNIRFNTDNIWVSCYKCNVMLSGNQLQYRIRLIEKIGIKRVEHLETISKEIRRYSKNELLDIQKEFKEKTKQLINK